MKKEIKELLTFLDESPTMYHATKKEAAMLDKAGFLKLDIRDRWDLVPGGSYYYIHNDSAIIALKVGSNPRKGFKIIGSHNDSPGFKIKPNSEMKSNGYIVLNTEVYGGPILNTWLDRPLSIAGRVAVKSSNPLKPKIRLVNIEKNLLIIPNLAIHMNREQDNKLNPQLHTLPILTIARNEVTQSVIDDLICTQLEIDKNELLDYDLYLYATEKASLVGLDDEFVSSGRIDNLGMAYASLEALINAQVGEMTNVYVAFDNEEVGSNTTQGAGSGLLRNVLQKISLGLGNTQAQHISAIYNSFMISADQAHSVHPNYGDKADPTNRPIINKGPVIKQSASKSYASDSYGVAVFKQFCELAEVPYQTYVNRSDIRGGSTIGPLTEQNADIKNVDIGNALLGMHSVRELAGVDDHIMVKKVFEYFYEEK